MMYILLAIFLVRYARKVERNPEVSLVYKEDRQGRSRHEASLPDALLGGQAIPRRAIIWLFACLGLILAVLVVVPFLPALSDFSLPLVGLLFFIGSGSAKAFLLMPIVLPLADLVGVTRQVTVTAYYFGDGFTNLAYPTNPVLLICLGLTIVSYPKWMKWTLPLWIGVLLVALFFMGLGVAIRLGPF